MMFNDEISLQKLNAFFSAYTNTERKVNNLYLTRLLSFFENYRYREAVFNSIKRSMDKSLSTDFNIFRIMKKESDENSISDIIADMLNPKGTHGQDVLFLEKFVDTLIFSKITKEKYSYLKNPLVLEKASVFREHTTSGGRRIDIVIAIENFFYIGIENKIYAGDQKLQIDDYIEYINKISNNKSIFFYLTPTGKNPESHSYSIYNTQNNFYCISYFKNIASWLDICYRYCESWRYKMLINDFIETIKSYNIEE